MISCAVAIAALPLVAIILGGGRGLLAATALSKVGLKTRREENMYKSARLFFTAIFVCVSAGAALAASSGPSTKPGNLVLSGTGTAASSSDVNPTTGACTFSSWVDVCSGTNCSCLTLSTPKVSGSGLKGATVTDFFVTTDNGINPATQPAVGGGPNPKCNPFFAVLVLSQSTGSTTINFMGDSCKHVIGISKKNPRGNHDKDTLSGGWGIDSASTPSASVSGWGTFTGTVNHTTNAVSLKASGLITTAQ